MPAAPLLLRAILKNIGLFVSTHSNLSFIRKIFLLPINGKKTHTCFQFMYISPEEYKQMKSCWRCLRFQICNFSRFVWSLKISGSIPARRRRKLIRSWTAMPASETIKVMPYHKTFSKSSL